MIHTKKFSHPVREGKYVFFLPLLEMFLFHTAALNNQDDYLPAFTFCGTAAVQ